MSKPRDSALDLKGGGRGEMERAERPTRGWEEVRSPDVRPRVHSHPDSVTRVAAGLAVVECWLVEDAGRGRLAKRPAALLLRQGPGEPPLRPDLDPELYLQVRGESSRTRPRLSASTETSSALGCAVTSGLGFPPL